MYFKTNFKIFSYKNTSLFEGKEPVKQQFFLELLHIRVTWYEREGKKNAVSRHE